MLFLLICRIVRINPRRHCLVCGGETMRAYAPVSQTVLQPLHLNLRWCRSCRRRWVTPMPRPLATRTLHD